MCVSLYILHSDQSECFIIKLSVSAKGLIEHSTRTECLISNIQAFLATLSAHKQMKVFRLLPGSNLGRDNGNFRICNTLNVVHFQSTCRREVQIECRWLSVRPPPRRPAVRPVARRTRLVAVIAA